MGASLFNPSDIAGPLVAYKKRVSKNKGLYFVKVDIKSCFDTITQDKLVQVLETLLGEVRSAQLTHNSAKTRLRPSTN